MYFKGDTPAFPFRNFVGNTSFQIYELILKRLGWRNCKPGGVLKADS